MRYLIKFISVLLLFTFFLMETYTASAASSINPYPKKRNQKAATVSVGSSSHLTAPDDFRNTFAASFNAFNQMLSDLPAAKDNPSVAIGIAGKGFESEPGKDALIPPANREGYALEITADSIKVIGSDLRGALHGMTTLEKLIKNHNGKIPQGQITDWPDHKIRGLHLVIRAVHSNKIRDIIKEARYGNYNHLIIQVGDGIQFTSLKGMVRKDAWTKEELLSIVNFARENGMFVIPEIKLLTHQEKLFQSFYPHLMYNKSTYDPRQEEVYALVFSLIDEIIALIKPQAIHIGHDEVAGYSEKSSRTWLRRDEKMLPAELFLKDVLRIYGYLKDKRTETWMWGDMLVDKKEFPGMGKHGLHGNSEYAELRNRIPKDIVICDSHYYEREKEFPTSLLLALNGNRVIGSTWKNEATIKNFSRYLANMPVEGEGMMATTWFHVQQGEWSLVSRLITISAEAFWNAK